MQIRRAKRRVCLLFIDTMRGGGGGGKVHLEQKAMMFSDFLEHVIQKSWAISAKRPIFLPSSSLKNHYLYVQISYY